MSKAPKMTIQVKGTAITVLTQKADDYISLTDIARYRDAERTDYLIQNWLRNRNTIEFLGIWESLNNPDFKPIEFDGFKKQAGLNSFILTAKQWIEKTGGSRNCFPVRTIRGFPGEEVRTARLQPLPNREEYETIGCH